MKAKVLRTSAIALILASCGVQEQTSQVSDVSNPGQMGEDNTLFWTEGTDLMIANCPKDKPVTRAHCNVNTRKQPLTQAQATTKQTLTNSIDQLNAQIAAEIKALKDADPTVRALQSKVQTLTDQKSRLSASISTHQSELTTAQAEKTKLDSYITQIDLELARITKALEANPRDPELLASQEIYMEQKSSFTEQSTAFAETIAALTRKIAWENATLEKVTTDLTATQQELTKVYAELEVTSPKLVQLNGDLKNTQKTHSKVDAVFQKIGRADVTYLGSTFSANEQTVLTLLKSSMGSGLKQGTYQKEPGGYNFCPQRVTPTISNGVMTSVRLTYLSPCGGSSETYTCSQNSCKLSSNRAEVKVLGFERYEFIDSGYKAFFKFQSSDMSGEGTPNGPLTHTEN